MDLVQDLTNMAPKMMLHVSHLEYTACVWLFYIRFSLCLSEQGGITVAYHPVNKMYLKLSLLTMEM